jgi:hypothetical protein
MKKTGLLALLAAALCASAPAATIVYTVDMSGANEAPPNASVGTGSGYVKFDTTLNTMHVHLTFADVAVLPFGTGNSTNSHIHCCTALPFTATAGVATVTPTFPGFPGGPGVHGGTYDHTFDLTMASTYNTNAGAFFANNGGTAAGAEAALLAGAAAGKAYWNVHSSLLPGGEIRGFLIAAPEPATFVFTGLGLVVAMLARKRLKRA